MYICFTDEIQMKKLILSFSALFYAANFAVGQCAMCKATLESNDEFQASGINSGILYIMAVPYLILFFVFRKKIFSFIKEFRSAQG